MIIFVINSKENTLMILISPSRWVQLCKAALSVALGNIGLVSFVKMEECRGNSWFFY